MPTSKKQPRDTALPKYSLVIPVRNGGELLLDCLRAAMEQTAMPAEIIVFDTDSNDGATAQLKAIAAKTPFRLIKISKHEFDHGGTRSAALRIARHDWVLFITQDAVFANPGSVARLLEATRQPKVGAVYARQLPHTNATPLASSARFINYGEERIVQNLQSAASLGIKTWFTSNSCCLWHKPTLTKAGGFASSLILGEDMHAAARIIQAGATVIYEPEAEVRHSHNYSAWQEFTRYFDIGVFHSQHADLLFTAGSANKEGFRFVKRQASLLWKSAALLSLMLMPFHIAAKFLGYKLGRKYTVFGRRICRMLSMHKNYWK
ncbi:glycosyltransferase family 2 protein [Turneriella parva]|uniref:Glycosyl transferase family 2 n=1 Tax=Turneriella parva (strain ATCC BAA-1111 / DSM 21527 / NCTC 11395 / H) TaxID=869212 RepID=I4B5C2_TURPD|nr:glycosyltransferase family 2 protein [Turneriella parva]AFM12479.1 glycosyl transferase family 2 [Turneriella parva DSM 21527]